MHLYEVAGFSFVFFGDAPSTRCGWNLLLHRHQDDSRCIRTRVPKMTDIIIPFIRKRLKSSHFLKCSMHKPRISQPASLSVWR